MSPPPKPIIPWGLEESGFDGPFDEPWEPHDISWFQRATIAAQLLEVGQLESILAEAQNAHDRSWIEAITGTINSVKAYKKMVDEPRKRQRLAEMDHELALKDKEIELKRIELQLEQARLERQDRERERDREHELTLYRVRSELKRMELTTTQPFELQKNLSALILAAWEKQERDPTARATFGNLQEIINHASRAVSQLTLDRDAEGQPLDDATRQQAHTEALELVMRVADRLISRL